MSTCWVIRAVAPTIGSVLTVDDEMLWFEGKDVFGPRPHYRIRLRGIDATVFGQGENVFGAVRAPSYRAFGQVPLRGIVEETVLAPVECLE